MKFTRVVLVLCGVVFFEVPLGEAQDAAASAEALQAIESGGHGAPTAPPGSLNAEEAEGTGRFMGGLRFESLGHDYFLTLDLYNELTLGPVSLGLHVPLRLRIIDKDPQDDGVFRSEDWDEVSDYARLLHFLELRFSGEDWHFRGRFGSLESESLGHGTIVAGYRSTIDLDHYQGGLALAAAIKYGGIEFMLDNFFDPEIFGFRFHVRPGTFFSDSEWAQRLAVGVSYAADTNAPLSLIDEMPGNGAFDPAVDDENNFGLESTDRVGVIGFDVEYTVLSNALLDLVPYVDVNVLRDQETGVGLHLGTFFNVRIPSPVGPTLLTRLEYRVFGDGYSPRYFDSIYEAQRIMYRPDEVVASPGDPIPLTKLGWLRTGTIGTHGWLGELYLDFGGFVRIGGTFEDSQGPNNSALTLVLLLPELGPVRAGAQFSNRGFDGFSEAFDLEGALLVATLSVEIYGPLYIQAAYMREWRVDENGQYRTENDWNVGVGVSFEY